MYENMSYVDETWSQYDYPAPSSVGGNFFSVLLQRHLRVIGFSHQHIVYATLCLVITCKNTKHFSKKYIMFFVNSLIHLFVRCIKHKTVIKLPQSAIQARIIHQLITDNYTWHVLQTVSQSIVKLRTILFGHSNKAFC